LYTASIDNIRWKFLTEDLNGGFDLIYLSVFCQFEPPQATAAADSVPRVNLLIFPSALPVDLENFVLFNLDSFLYPGKISLEYMRIRGFFPANVSKCWGVSWKGEGGREAREGEWATDEGKASSNGSTGRDRRAEEAAPVLLLSNFCGIIVWFEIGKKWIC
jgi:hypothetical protein